ncbi:MAG: hypothetical protein DIU72_011590 [Pseudomonadota bacterium]
MKLRALASLFLATSIVAAAGTASAQAADTSKVLGLRFETTLFQPFDVRGISLFEEGPTVQRIDVFRPNGDIRIGYDLPFGLTPMIGFGLRSHSVKVFDTNDEEISGTGVTNIVLSAELRYYFGPHKRGLQPYVFGEFNTTIASFGFSPDEVAEAMEDLADALGDLNSFMNLNAGLGLEYKFARSFGVGAKWGFGISLAPNDRHENVRTKDGEPIPAQSNTVWGTSSSIYLAFRL